MNKSLTVKVIVFFLSLFIIITVSSQIYFMVKGNYHTEEAVYYTVSDTISFKGIFVRNETVINTQASGVLNYVHPDGSKIAKNSVIAQVYSSENDIASMKRIDELKKELELLERVINPGVIATAQPEFIAKQIDEKYLLLENHIENNDFERITSTKQDILMLMNIYNLVTKTEDKSAYNLRINELKSEISTLSSTVSPPYSEIRTEIPGYFVSHIDGYENILNMDNINDMTYDQLIEIIKSPPKSESSCVGKMIDGYKWKMIGVINTSNRFIKDKKLYVRLSGSVDLIPVTVDEVKTTDNPDECIIILSCEKLSYQLVQNRVANAELVFQEYSGVKVSREAIRFRNGEKGVYIVIGQEKLFKKLDVIYKGDDFVISKLTSDSSYIGLYDQILFEEVNTLGTDSSESEN